MKYKFTQYGFINALWSLIPIFPLWSLFPGIGLAEAINSVVKNCETGYSIVFRICFFGAIGIIFFCVKFFDKYSDTNDSWIFKLWCFAFYTLVNIAFLLMSVGPTRACTGDGQTALQVIYTAPLASLSLVLLGLIVDLRKMHNKRFKSDTDGV